ncbi:hypothetical protein Arub01_22080 [Actinomadura rubrobrunea]|uniref:Uncharacterized protein n=1 Tax=Actinomadura rubrobrunea TaxID=115335 RepID=A0A9W6UUJ0_9ACTN|nr:DUF6059 family protein [Actinomadura rubrobrunea]GLW63964.1 hypothetical protein Arub01_22080 [Actinomadura rubrobrunea]
MGRGLPRRLLRYVWSGLAYVGYGMAGAVLGGHQWHAARTPPTPSVPPPAHPERLVPDVPLSEEEARLWAQLDGFDR